MASLVWSAFFLLICRSDVGHYLDSRISRPVDFRVRDYLGRSPELSDKLKIYSIDDTTFAKLGSWVLRMEQWSKVLSTLAANEPRAIFIDAMFSSVDGLQGDDIRASIDEIAAITKGGTPIYVGSFVTPTRIRYRDPLPLDRPEYSLGAMLGKAPGDAFAEHELPPMGSRSDWVAYGPSPDMRAAIAGVGHFSYGGGSTIAPLLRLGNDAVLPHLTLFLAKERKILDGKLVADGVTVPVDAQGNLTVNFMPPEDLYNVHKSMRGLLKVAENGETLKKVNKGDVILILPLMYTGHTDFKYTPFGNMPGGFVLAAMLNSILTEQWLKPLVGGEALVVGMTFLGAFIGMKCAALLFSLGAAGIVVLVLALSQYLFAYHGIIVPWLFPILGFIGAAITVFAEKTRVGEKKVQALRYALEGSVAKDDLKSILKNPERVTLEARERVVTLMFIDVVGFSLLAENMLPRMAFDNLKKMLAMIGEVVHEFGGIIDKTLGDGLLCYFGYRFDVDSSSPDHAEKALRCAIKIQRDNLMRNIEAAENGEPVYPLRVGINTSSCYLGDLGTSNRIDFTVVGNGVNFAKRLEGACEMHSVLMGGTTYDLVKSIGLETPAVTQRFIRIKHHSELVEAFEYDPFHAEPDLRAVALDGFRKCANIERLDQRWPVHDPSKIQLSCDFGDGQLVNFSHTGLSVKLKQLLAKGTRMNLTLDGAGGALKALLAKEGIDILQGEVRWGYAEGSEFVHGVMLTNVSERQSDFLVQYLCEFAFSREAGRETRQPATKDGKAS